MVVYSMDDRGKPLKYCRQVTLNKLAGPQTTHRHDRQTYVCMDRSCSLISITRRNAAPTLGYCCRLAVASCTARVISSTTRHRLLSKSHYARKPADCSGYCTRAVKFTQINANIIAFALLPRSQV